MSINTLTVDNPDKSWANLYVNSMTVYNDLEVRGNITNTGSVSGDVTHEDNVLIKGKLTLDSSNNPANDAIQIIGGKEIQTDGIIVAPFIDTTSLIVNADVQSALILTGTQNTEPFAIDITHDKPIQTIGDVICRDVQATGDIQANSIIFDLNGQAIEQYDYHDDIVSFNTFDNPIFSNVDIKYSASIIGKDGNDTIVNVVFNFNGSEFVASGSGTLNSTPIESEFRPLAGNTCKVLCVVNDQTGRHMAIAELKSDGELYIYNDLDEAFYPVQLPATQIGPIADISFTFTRRAP